jgi:tetratricopeptide (TPR) repeat protein
MDTGSTAFRTFVGRERELALLRCGLDKATCGKGTLFLVGGKRGSGKTSLSNQLAREAQTLGVQSIFINENLEEHCPAGPEVPFDLTGVTRCFPNISRRDPRDRPHDEPIPRIHRAQPAHEPALFIFEDVHRWSTRSLDELAILAGNISSAPALVVATYSEGEVRRDPLRRSLLAGMARFAFNLMLAEFDEATTCRFVEALIGREHNPRLADEIFRATGGNPLLIEHVLRAWFTDQRRGQQDEFLVDAIAIPLPVRDLFSCLLEEVSPPSRELLNAAAVFEREFALDMLAQVCEFAGCKFFDAIDELERADLLTRDREDTGILNFRQSLMRQLLYREMSSFRRAELHYRAASASERLRGTTLDVASTIVEHLRRALNEGGTFGCTNRNSSNGAKPEDNFRLASLVRLGENQARAGLHQAALSTLSNASELADQIGDATSMATIALALPSHLLPLPGAPNFTAALLARKVLAKSDPLDSELRAQLCARLAGELSYSSETFDQAQELMNKALETVDDCRPAVELRVRVYRDTVLRGPLVVDERIDNATRLSELAVGAGDRTAAHVAYVASAIAHLQRGETARARSAWDCAVVAAGNVPGPSERLSIAAYSASSAFCMGRLDEAGAFLRQALELAADGTSEFLIAASAVLSRERAAYSDAYQSAQRLTERWPAIATYRVLLALTQLDLGRERDARFHFEALFGDHHLHLPHEELFLPCAALLAELCVELGDQKRSAELYSRLIPYSSLFVFLGQGFALGPVSLHLGSLATFLRRFELASQHLGTALCLSRSAGLRTWSAHANYLLAHCLALEGDRVSEGRCRDCIGEAVVEAEALGMTRLLKKAQSLQESLQVSPFSDGSKGRYLFNGAGPPVEVSPRAPLQTSSGITFWDEGETYLLAFRGKEVRLRKSKGLKLIITLIAAPDREFHVYDLELAAGNSYIRDNNGAGEGEGEPQLDATAKQSYRLRLQDLREELGEARAFNDPHRTSVIEEEIAFLARELARAVGLKGSDRKTFSDAERARARVTQAIHSALRKVSHHDPTIGWYLASTVKTGNFCSYSPNPEVGSPPDVRSKITK